MSGVRVTVMVHVRASLYVRGKFGLTRCVQFVEVEPPQVMASVQEREGGRETIRLHGKLYPSISQSVSQVKLSICLSVYAVKWETVYMAIIVSYVHLD